MQSRTTGIAATIIFHALLLAALYACGFRIPYPPPEEQGMLISLGNADFGKGDYEPLPSQLPSPSSLPKNDGKEPSLTQDYEDAPSLPKKERKRRKPQDMPLPAREQARQEQRIVNQEALFRGQNNSISSASQGEGKDGNAAQNQGAPNGSAMAAGTQTYGSGNSVNLQGRSLIGALPAPNYDVQESGRVIVKIKVDRSGSVVEAKAQQSGSTLINATLYAAAERAAERAKFNPAPEGAPPYQNGTIAYVFKMGGR